MLWSNRFIQTLLGLSLPFLLPSQLLLQIHPFPYRNDLVLLEECLAHFGTCFGFFQRFTVFIRIAARYDGLILGSHRLRLIFLLIQFAEAHFRYGNSHELKVNVFFLFVKILACHRAHENLSRYSLHGFYIKPLYDELRLLNLLTDPLIGEFPKREIAPNDPTLQ